jgi:L-arabinokinase
MYKIIQGNSQDLPDVVEFVEQLNRLGVHPEEAVRGLFEPAHPLVLARAPGRLDLMGGIADYSGSLVLQMPIQEATLVALQPVEEPLLRVVSLGHERQGELALFSMPLADLLDGDQPASYTGAQAYFKRRPQKLWAAYVAGGFLVLMREPSLRPLA